MAVITSMTRQPNKIKILHLEDYASDAALVKNSLTRNGLVFDYCVVTKREGYIEGLRSFEPDLVISDHNLPDLNSLEAFNLLQQENLNIPFILLTGYLDDATALKYLQHGVNDYLLKDNLGRLVPAIENLLARYSLEREKKNYEQRLIASERKFRKLTESGSDVVCILAKNREISYLSPSAKNILDVDPKFAIGKCIVDLLNTPQKKVFQHAVKGCLGVEGAIINNVEISFKTAIKGLQYFYISLINMTKDPDINGIMINFREITAQKKIEQQIIASERKYRAFLITV